jgi:hypothetical protein
VDCETNPFSKVVHARSKLPLTEHGESAPSVAHARSESLFMEHGESAPSVVIIIITNNYFKCRTC